MTGKQALGLMLIDDKIIAIRDTVIGTEATSGFISANGINFTPEQLTSDKWELGRECNTCIGTGEIPEACPKCSGRSLQSLLENPCCDGVIEVECRECEGGTVWSEEY